MDDSSRVPGSGPSTSQHMLAGALIWRQGSQGPEIALVDQNGRWTLPRVAVQQGEDRSVIAARLVTQWTGRPATPMGFVGQTQAALDDHDLSTWYFSFVVDSLGVAKQQAWLRWVVPKDAVARLNDPKEADILSAASAPNEVRKNRRLRDSSKPNAQAICAVGLLMAAFFSAADQAGLGQNLLLGALAANLTALVVAARVPRLHPAPAWIIACAGAACALLGSALQAQPGIIIGLGVAISLLTARWERDSQDA